MLNFPSSPTIGQQHTVAGKSWEWTGAAWKSISTTIALVERAEDAAAEAVASAAAAAQVEANMGAISTSLADAHAQIDGFGAADGAGKVGYDGGTVQDVLDGAKAMQSYTALRAYTGRATAVRITTPGIAGIFQRTGDTAKADNGGTVIVDAADRRWERLPDGPINVQWFGALGTRAASDAYAFQKAMNFAHSIGGGTVLIPTPSVAWLLDYPVFIRDRTHVIGTGTGCKIVFKNPTYEKGRGGFVMGSSLEANRDTALANYAAGTSPGASTRNNSFVNPALKQYLRDNPQFVQARDSSISNVYLIAEFDDPAEWGGYGINIVNAWNCHAHDIWGDGWTQLVGMGSDVPPETPSNHLCSARNIHVIKPDAVHTYYAGVFVANSTDCEVADVTQHAACTVGTPDGSGNAGAYLEDCVFRNIRIPKLGRTATSQGLLLHNTKGCTVDGVDVGDAKTGVATYFTDASFNDPARPNKIFDVSGSSDKVVELGAKYAIVSGIRNTGAGYDFAFLNSDASNNTVLSRVEKVYTPNDQARHLYFADNSVQGWRPKAIYLRPADLLLNEKAAAALAYDANKGVEAKAASPLYFLWRPGPDVRAISSVETFITYRDNAQAAGANFKIQLRRMAGFNGNAGEGPYIEAAVTDTASNTATLDKSVGLSGAFVEVADTAHGLANSVDVLLTLDAPTIGSVVKETRIIYFGD